MSFMAKYELSGPDVDAAVKLLFTKNVSEPGRMTYALMLNKDAGIETDVVVAKINSNNGEFGSISNVYSVQKFKTSRDCLYLSPIESFSPSITFCVYC